MVTFSPAALVFICTADFTNLLVSQVSQNILRVLRGIRKNLEGSGRGLLDAPLVFPKSLLKATYTTEQSVFSGEDSNRVISTYKQQANSFGLSDIAF